MPASGNQNRGQRDDDLEARGKLKKQEGANGAIFNVSSG